MSGATAIGVGVAAMVADAESRAIHGLFPREVVTVLATEEMETARLLAEEEACIPRAVPKRRREFTLGRACARQALARFGVHDFPLLPGAHRAPLWPVGLVGSITHCHGLCAVVVARQGRILGLGLDAEPALPFPPDIIRRVCSEAEVSHIDTLPAPPAGDWYRLVFSAKESVYKACYPRVGRVLEFSEVEVGIDPVGGGFSARATNPELAALFQVLGLRGRYAFTDSHVVTGITAAGGAS